MVFCPPRHGKSELASRRFPAWYLGNYPDRQIITASYNADLAADFGRDVRDNISSEEYQSLFPNVRLRPDIKAAGRWNTTNGGIYVSAGIGSGITGRGAHVALIDDPHKDREDADSETRRNKVWNWYCSTLYTRLMPTSAIILIMTRWHENDLAGRLLRAMKEGDEFADQWMVINLPAIAETDDMMGRAEGEPLWPESYPIERLYKNRSNIGSREFISLYQQRPSAASGTIFLRDQIRGFTESPRYLFKLQSWDTAVGEREQNHYCACTTWGLTEWGYYVEEAWRKKMEYPHQKQAVESKYEQHKPNVVLIENKSTGQALIADLKRSRIPIKAIEVPHRDKVARANSTTPLFEAGKVFVKEGTAWFQDFIDELCGFPSGSYDDWVDTVTQALDYARNKHFGLPIYESVVQRRTASQRGAY